MLKPEISYYDHNLIRSDGDLRRVILTDLSGFHRFAFSSGFELYQLYSRFMQTELRTSNVDLVPISTIDGTSF